MKKLLVVDDNVIDAGFVSRAFAEVNGALDIVHALDADSAVERLAIEHFDYVLLDINMPGIDGMELLRRIRKDRMTAITPVIMLTSSSKLTDVDQSYAAGANAYAIKPVTVSGYRQFAEAFNRFWVDLAVPPHSSAAV